MKKNLSVLIAGLCFASLFVSCGGNKKAEVKGDVEAKGYTFGEEVTFHSDEPVTYSIGYVRKNG